MEIHASIRLVTKTWYDDRTTACPSREERLIETTVGRVIFNRILPEEIQFVNWQLDKGGLKDLVAELYEVGGEENTPDVADAIKDIGFTYATRSGYTHRRFRHHRPGREAGDHRPALCRKRKR